MHDTERTNSIRTWRLETNQNILIDLDPTLESLDEVSRRLPNGAFTTFRTYAGRTRVVGLRHHLNRLQNSAAQMGWAGQLDQAALRRTLSALLDHVAPAEARVRLTLDTSQRPGDLYLSLQPLHPLPPEVYTQGVKARTCDLRRDDPEVKTTEFIPASRALKATMPVDIFELLLLDDAGRILEGITSNFFAVLEGKLHTAEAGVLPGVTRRVALNLAEVGGFEVVYQPVALADLSRLQEAFLTSSSRGIVPVVEIDGCALGDGRPGPITRRLLDLYTALLEEQSEMI